MGCHGQAQRGHAECRFGKHARAYGLGMPPKMGCTLPAPRAGCYPPPVDAQIISIGTELTSGLTVDANAAWLARRLAAIGLHSTRHVTVPDDAHAIRSAITQAADHATVVLVTGGIGPTDDDLTRQAVADAAGKPLVIDPTSAQQIRDFFRRVERPMPDTNDRQAYLPQGAAPLENPCGTAPGFRVQIARALVFVMPGVPREMKAMFQRSVEPELAARSSGSAIVTRTIRCFGASEANVGEQLADLMTPGREPGIGITAEGGVLSLHITARGDHPDDAATLADQHARIVRRRLGHLVFGQGDQTLQQAVAELLLDRGHTVATAESCTGGLLAKRLTDVPGSSAYFLGGFVTYHNDFKIRFLDLPPELIARHGAVSQQVAQVMADRCRQITAAEFSLSTTGIAGPTGGSDEKPVGLVYVGFARPDETVVHRFTFGSHQDRQTIRDRFCKVALNILRLHLTDAP